MAEQSLIDQANMLLPPEAVPDFLRLVDIMEDTGILASVTDPPKQLNLNEDSLRGFLDYYFVLANRLSVNDIRLSLIAGMLIGQALGGNDG